MNAASSSSRRLSLFAVAGLAIWALIWQLDLTVNGLLVGSVYALGAVGLSLVYGNLHLPNIAHGDYMTLGALRGFVRIHIDAA